MEKIRVWGRKKINWGRWYVPSMCDIYTPGVIMFEQWKRPEPKVDKLTVIYLVRYGFTGASDVKFISFRCRVCYWVCTCNGVNLETSQIANANPLRIFIIQVVNSNLKRHRFPWTGKMWGNMCQVARISTKHSAPLSVINSLSKPLVMSI